MWLGRETVFLRGNHGGVGALRGGLMDLYGFAVEPAAGFYFRIALNEIRKYSQFRSGGEAVADASFADDLMESFRIFQCRIIEEYERMIDELGSSSATPACRSSRNSRR